MKFRALIGCCAGAIAAFALVGTAVANNGNGNGNQSTSTPAASSSAAPASNGNGNGNGVGNGNGNQSTPSASASASAAPTGTSNGNAGGNGAAPATANGAGGNGTGSNHTAPGDSNHGDVWVDAAGAPPGPGHEMDPHLPCGTINLWGSFMADASGTFDVFAWPPTGNKGKVVTGSWAYVGTGHNTEQIGSFTILKSGHYYLTVNQDPVKHKTFWVKCPAQTPSPTPTPMQHQHHQKPPQQQQQKMQQQKQAMKGGAGAAKAANKAPGLPQTGVQQLASGGAPVALIGALLLASLIVGLVFALRRRQSDGGSVS